MLADLFQEGFCKKHLASFQVNVDLADLADEATSWETKPDRNTPA
jgi:hypothetical protein